MIERETPGHSLEPEEKKQKTKNKKQKIHPHFECLEGLASTDPLYEHRKAYIYEQFIGDKTEEMFKKYGQPHPEELSAVYRTLRAVFGGEFSREMARWEKSRQTGSHTRAPGIR